MKKEDLFIGAKLVKPPYIVRIIITGMNESHVSYIQVIFKDDPHHEKCSCTWEDFWKYEYELVRCWSDVLDKVPENLKLMVARGYYQKFPCSKSGWLLYGALQEQCCAKEDQYMRLQKEIKELDSEMYMVGQKAASYKEEEIAPKAI